MRAGSSRCSSRAQVSGLGVALVAALGIGQRRVQDGDAVSEASLETAERLGRERDLGHENDRSQSVPERRRARLEVDLGLPAPSRAVQENMSSARLKRRDDSCAGLLLRAGQLAWLGLARERAE